jgi:multidrug efflux system outer membrane protein
MSGYRLVAPALLLVLGGCAAGPDYERPELEVPEKYIQPVQQGESFANTPWWELFEDPQLQELIRIALEENQDLGIAAARVEEFRAVLGGSGRGVSRGARSDPGRPVPDRRHYGYRRPDRGQ